MITRGRARTYIWFILRHERQLSDIDTIFGLDWMRRWMMRWLLLRVLGGLVRGGSRLVYGGDYCMLQVEVVSAVRDSLVNTMECALRGGISAYSTGSLGLGSAASLLCGTGRRGWGGCFPAARVAFERAHYDILFLSRWKPLSFFSLSHQIPWRQVKTSS